MPPSNDVFYTFPDLWEEIADSAESEFLVPHLLPGEGVVLLHGQPRAGKTLVALELAVALATGTTPFRSPRMKIESAMPVLYVTGEDHLRVTAERLGALAFGRGINEAPDTLYVLRSSGFCLDQPNYVSEIQECCEKEGIRFVVFDPLRRLTANADQGPAELMPVAARLAMLREAVDVVVLVHHDTKSTARSTRRAELPHLASGGGVFGISDAPIHVRRVGEDRVVLTPSRFKFTADPDRCTVRMDFSPQDGCPAIRLTEYVAHTGRAHVDLKDRIIARLDEGPAPSASALARQIHAGKRQVLEALDELKRAGEVQDTAYGRATQWARSVRRIPGMESS